MKRTGIKRKSQISRGSNQLKRKEINKVSKSRQKQQNALKAYMSKTTNCPICGTVGKHSWHHVFNGPYKWLSEKYMAFEYPCWACHTLIDGNVHENEELRTAWKRKWQKKIMKREEISLDQWIEENTQSWL